MTILVRNRMTGRGSDVTNKEQNYDTSKDRMTRQSVTILVRTE